MQKDLKEFHGHLSSGAIQRAYRALLFYILGLRSHFKSKHPEFFVSSLYQGYMDMTYFAISPPSLKQLDLKIAIVFNYKAFRFEAWLAGKNRSVNRHYGELFKDLKKPEYRIVTPGKGVDMIIECDLAHGFELDETHAITATIENGIGTFIEDIEELLPEGQAMRRV
ncbi:MAG: hypothetical protein P8X96_18415 [Desulfobacteraceae bacterium]